MQPQEQPKRSVYIEEMGTLLKCTTCKSTVKQAAALPGETVFVCECDTALEVTGMSDFDLKESLPSKWSEREI